MSDPSSRVTPGSAVAGLPGLRLATIADVPVLSALIERSARGLSRPFYDERTIESAIRHVFGVDSTLIEDGTYFVAETEGRVEGCGGWSSRHTLYGGDQRPIGPPARLDPSRDPARIRAFFVEPTAARRGVGRRLYGACATAARAAGFQALELMSTLPGVPFYETLGFSAVGPVTDVLPDGVTIRFVRMRAPLGT